MVFGLIEKIYPSEFESKPCCSREPPPPAEVQSSSKSINKSYILPNTKDYRFNINALVSYHYLNVSMFKQKQMSNLFSNLKVLYWKGEIKMGFLTCTHPTCKFDSNSIKLQCK